MVKRSLTPLWGFMLLTIFFTQPAFAQQSNEEYEELRKEIDELKKGQAIIQKQLAEMKALLLSAQRKALGQPENIVVNVDGHPFKGSESARLTLIEFSDYQ
ncbi:hypothetical protein MYX78_12805 [Acidobacteria bacterium AH-259-G07]|nr:hypothetical protein [Acidobacteria bacterium AH-259-G07]MDA2938406.1 hypothetical protein [Acidobacteria bacterium AH-259-A15]